MARPTLSSEELIANGARAGRIKARHIQEGKIKEEKEAQGKPAGLRLGDFILQVKKEARRFSSSWFLAKQSAKSTKRILTGNQSTRSGFCGGLKSDLYVVETQEGRIPQRTDVLLGLWL